MTKEEMIELAKQAGFERLGHTAEDWVCHLEDIEEFTKLVAEKEREKVTKERDRMCKHCKWKNDENSTLDETNQSKVLGKG